MYRANFAGTCPHIFFFSPIYTHMDTSYSWAPALVWSLSRVIACHRGNGMCVSQKHRVVIVSTFANQLCVYSMDDGSLLGEIGIHGKGQFTYRKVPNLAPLESKRFA